MRKYMKSKLFGVFLCLILVGSVLLPLGVFVGASGEGPAPDRFVPYQRLPEDIRVTLEENASSAALESIRGGHPPQKELVKAGLGREEFEGDVYPVYHSRGAVYIFRGSGEVRFPDGDSTGVVLSGDDRVAVGEAWPTQTLEAMMGKREPPPAGLAPSISDRIYAGIQTYEVSNKYFGVSARVQFPQFVDTSSPYWCFNIHTTHVVFSDGNWFESLVGQYKWWGGDAKGPTAGFWVSWGFWQYFYKMTPSPGSYKLAHLLTCYTDPTAHMAILDVDQDIMYTRTVSRAGATTRRVTLVHEQYKDNPVCVTDYAYFQPTYINTFGNQCSYVDWNTNTGYAALLENDPMQHEWLNYDTYEFKTRCVV